MKKIEFKKGKYYIGDPCYIFSTDEWSEVLDNTDYFDKQLLTINGKTYPVLGGSTAYGDGAYLGTDGNTYGVDSGMIAIIPLKACTKTEIYNHRQYGLIAQIKNLKEPFTASVDNGVFTFGDLVIDTERQDEYE